MADASRAFTVIKDGVQDISAKLRQDPRMVRCALTQAGEAMVMDKGIDGQEGDVLCYLHDHPGGRTISESAKELRYPVQTVQRVMQKYAKMRPPCVQIQ
jgi:hypothetical protein